MGTLFEPTARPPGMSTTSIPCDLCNSLLTQCLSLTAQGRPQWLKFEHASRMERARRARSGCGFCSLSIQLELEDSSETSVLGAPLPASFWWCGGRYEIFEPGRLASAQDYDGRQRGRVNEGFADFRQPQRDVPRHANDVSSLALAKDWCHLCATQHPQCKRNATTPLPTRVIDVGEARAGNDVVYLVESQGRSGPYVALSHCWGGHQPLTTTSGNFHKHMAGIPIRTLPQTFRDAVTTVRALGLRNLWIDSLCIIQDSIQDWASEATKMADVYSNALFTISALSANSSKDGLFRPRSAPPTLLFQWKLTGEGGPPRILGLRASVPSFDEEMKASPLTSRGWVYQERLLSAAVLHFGREQLFWECKTAVLSQAVPILPETQPAVARHFGHLGFMSQDLTRQFWREFARFASGQRSWRNGPCGWKDVVRTFSRKCFTKPEDRYAAILGIAGQFKELARSPFFAGLWMADITLQLAWVFDEKTAGVAGGAATQTPIRSPSWSWISVDYPVTWMYDVEEREDGVEEIASTAALYGGGGGVAQAEDLVAFAQQSLEQFTLRIRERMAQPTSFEGVEKGGRIQVVMEKRRDWEVHELKGMLDPGRTLPKKIHLLRLRHDQFMILDEVAIFLILKRVGMPQQSHEGDLGTFKRIGIGSTSYEKMQDFFAFGKEGPLSLV